MVIQNDTVVVDLSRANVGAPATLKQLIAGWDAGTGTRLAALAAASAAKAPEFSMKVSAVKTLPPIPDPSVLLNAAVNYNEHGLEMRGAGHDGRQRGQGGSRRSRSAFPATGTASPATRGTTPTTSSRRRRRSPATAIPIILPPGRTQIDWECELNIVIGKTAKRVKAENAAEYIFGYTLDNDVSDRGGRADGRHGSDWVLGKSHDTFFPMGPYVVPRQFVANPQKLAIKFSLSGKVMQDSNTDRMTHNVYELVEYASHLITLRPGDMISSGSPAGVGTARGTPIYFKDGDTSDVHDRKHRHAREPRKGGQVRPADGRTAESQG